MEFIHSLGISLLYLVLLGIGLIYAVLILIIGAIHDLHIPGFEVHVGEHDFGPACEKQSRERTVAQKLTPSCIFGQTKAYYKVTAKNPLR